MLDTQGWLTEAAQEFGLEYRVDEGAAFVMLSPCPAAQAADLLAQLHDARRRVETAQPGIVHLDSNDKTAVMLLATREQYSSYIARFYPADAAYGYSGAMFIHAGHPHIVTSLDNLHRFERVMVHEIVHLGLQHLSLPAWLDEGIAVNVEQRLCGPAPARHSAEERERRHARHWNAATIQSFWSGDVFHAADAGQALGYDLAARMVTLIMARHAGSFNAFCTAAKRSDAGDAAALVHLHGPLHDYAGALLGPGEWKVHPSRWPAAAADGPALQDLLLGHIHPMEEMFDPLSRRTTAGPPAAGR